MSKRVHLSDSYDDEELKHLLERFIRKSEELEKRESEVLKHVELVQSAVASLQTWQQNGGSQSPRQRESAPVDSPSLSEPPPPRIDVSEIEKETKMAREETERIEREIEQKIEENKRLKEAIDRRNTLMANSALKKLNRTEIRIRAPTTAKSPARTYDQGIDYFSQKLQRLRAQEKNLKRQLDAENAKSNEKKKTELTEREIRVQRRLMDNGGKAPESSGSSGWK